MVWKTRQFDDILLRHCSAVYNQNIIDRWTKGCTLPFPKNGDLEIPKKYWGITLTSIAAKIYSVLQRNHIEPKIEKNLRKNQNGFRRNQPMISQILGTCKNLDATILFIDSSKAYDSLHRRKMEQILLADHLTKETVAAIDAIIIHLDNMLRWSIDLMK